MPEQAVHPSEIGGTHETAESDLVPPGAHGHEIDNPDPDAEIARLRSYLEERFPDQVDLSNRQVPESPVDIAIRLLSGYASVVTNRGARCDHEYCNKPQSHTDAHGWIHYG